MSGPIPVMPLDTLREKVGALIEEAKTRNLPMSTLTLLSIGEYLKDAERWAYIKHHVPPDIHKLPPAGLQNYVDNRIFKNER